ncbi:MAG TPA: hypothetical protein VNT53_00035 [Pseudolysinimonas sp.]|nr:hypothetical protein [Pseudolysinimonas sp.]
MAQDEDDGDEAAVDPLNQPVPSFAPNWPNDDRKEGDWASRYTNLEARRSIRWEATYVWACLVLSVIAIAGISAILEIRALPLSERTVTYFYPFALAFFGGSLGGTLFTMKWLYHSVAKGLWNRDRRLWRVFTPILSSGAALTFVLLCSSGVLPFFGPDLVRNPAGALGLGIVLGYFSDRAFSSLENVLSGLGMRKPSRTRHPESSAPPE